MRSIILKAFSVLGLGAIVVLVLGQAAVAAPPAWDPELRGTWRVQVTQVDCQTGAPLSPTPFPSLLTFAAGGTMAEDTTNPAFGPGQRGAGQGVWYDQGRRTFWVKSVAFINYTTPADPTTHNPGFEAGEQTITQTIKFTGRSDEWSSVAAITFTDTTGAVYRQGCALATATRF
jgi:hypothetical protein